MGNSASGRSWPRDVRDLFRGGGGGSGGTARSSRRRGDAAGGHHDRHHGAVGVDERRQDSAVDHGRAGATQRGAAGAGGRTNYSKLNSCPDLQVVARSGDPQRRQRNDVDPCQPPPMKLNVKIYRSYRSSNVAVVVKEPA